MGLPVALGSEGSSTCPAGVRTFSSVNPVVHLECTAARQLPIANRCTDFRPQFWGASMETGVICPPSLFHVAIRSLSTCRICRGTGKQNCYLLILNSDPDESAMYGSGS